MEAVTDNMVNGPERKIPEGMIPDVAVHCKSL